MTRVGGNPLFKLHPANWLFAMALLSNLLSKPDPVGYLSDLPRAFPGALLFVADGGFHRRLRHARATCVR